MNSASPLADLLAYIAEAKAKCNTVSPGGKGPEGYGAHAAEPPSVDYFRRTWSKVSTNRLLRESRAHVPDNAGPLNSSQLVHRALSVMRAVSPDYLHHALLYVEALSWMEQLKDAGQLGGDTRHSGKGTAAKGSKAVRRPGAAKKGLAGTSR